MWLCQYLESEVYLHIYQGPGHLGSSIQGASHGGTQSTGPLYYHLLPPYGGLLIVTSQSGISLPGVVSL